MAVKYVKDFFFGPMTSVQRYAKGGHVTKVPAKAKPAAKGMPAKAKPNAPAKGAKRMESPPKMGKGQGYKDGGKVPGKQMDRQPTKTPPGREKDLAPAKPFKGAYEGYAKGGKARRYAEGGDIEDSRAASIEPGDGSPLDAGAPRTMKTFDYSEPSRPISLNQYGEADPYADRPVRDISVSPYEGRQVPLNQYGEADPYGDRPVRDISVSPYEGRMSDPYAGLPEVRALPVQTDEDRARMVLDKYAPERGGKSIEPAYSPGPTRPYDPGVVEPLLEPSPYRPVDELMRGMIGMERKNVAPPSAEAMDNFYNNYLMRTQNLSGIGQAMRDEARRKYPAVPSPSDSFGLIGRMYAKGGHVKGQAKVGKVMSEYKAGELHSGSKKGPLVKNPKQAIAIALSEARKSGAKIPKKADGGMMASTDAYGDKKEPYRGPPRPKSVTVTKVTKTVSNAKDAALNEKKMLEFLRSLPKDEIADMMEKRAMQAPSMDPDMPKYRKGGMARKGVPAHKAKAMYGGGKC